MKKIRSGLCIEALACLVSLSAGHAQTASSVSAVSLAEPRLLAPAGGNSDSSGSVISADGRFVLFLSSANNLVTNDANGPFIDVFLRNRTNGTTTLVSVNVTGTGGGNGNSIFPGASADGRYVAFESEANNLVVGDNNNVSDVVVRDLQTGTTALVSVNSAGSGSNGASTSPVISADGRYVAFVSAASDLVANDTNGMSDVFVRDLRTGTTILVSVSADGATSGNDRSDSPTMTPDGRWIAFVSKATNLVAGVTNNQGEIYARDVPSGATLWVSTNSLSIMLGVNSQNHPITSYNPAISEDGKYVAFKSIGAAPLILRHNLQTGATDLATTNAVGDTDGFDDSSGPDITPDGRFIAYSAKTGTGTLTYSAVYLWDAQIGTNILVSANLSGQVSSNTFSGTPAVSADGKFVAFTSDAPDLVTNEVDGSYQVYVRDLASGRTRLVSADANGDVSGETGGAIPTITADGRYIAFDSFDGGYVPHDNNHAFDAFARDTVTDSTELVSRAGAGLQSLTGSGLSSVSGSSLSADGRYAAFMSLAGNLVPNDENDNQDIFVRDLQSGTNILVSINKTGTGTGAGVSSKPAMTPDGKSLVFLSSATNLVDHDDNLTEDVFVRDLRSGTTILASRSRFFDGTNSATPNGASSSPSISANGRYVAFASRATDITPDNTFPGDDIFAYDLQSGTTALVSVNVQGTGGGNRTSSNPLVSADGRYVVFSSSAYNLTTNTVPGVSSYVYIRDLQSATTAWLPYSTNSTYVLGANGQFLAVRGEAAGQNSITVRELATSLEKQVALAPPGPALGASPQTCAVSDDGRYVAFTSRSSAIVANDNNGAADVFLCDMQTSTVVLISSSKDHIGTGNADSDSPVISADGRFIAYRSSASDLVANDNNGQPDIFLFDRLIGSNKVISVNRVGTGSGNHRSALPLISANGNAVVFGSVASDLVAGDYNEAQDVFLYAVGATATVDSDGDGMDDNWEQDTFGDLSHDGLADTDGDGMSDLVEYKVGTSPRSASSAFRGEIFNQPVPGQTVVSWDAAPGRNYRVQYKNDLTELVWSELAGTVTVNGAKASIADDTAGTVSHRYYRIELVE